MISSSLLLIIFLMMHKESNPANGVGSVCSTNFSCLAGHHRLVEVHLEEVVLEEVGRLHLGAQQQVLPRLVQVPSQLPVPLDILLEVPPPAESLPYLEGSA